LRLPSVRLISRQDLKDAPSWIDRLLGPLNQFLGTVYQGLDKQLTFQENIRATVKELTFRTLGTYGAGDAAAQFTPIVFPTGLRVNAINVQIAQIYELSRTDFITTGAITPIWKEIDGNIHVLFISGLEVATQYFIRFVVY
jgi:hypothetical protein